ncbi:hypothetical protein AXFE_22760 [Acidithrix ferrooxidans]|uniref:Uncharacterized protein n=1 Tax=Acidithrix ferrooxidans TaxID=1280514 RepID=A0A0D8HFY6_9ACTN|nr:hypothetical protein AXFE_22760 [Acidithrix ferrooxidans]
MSMVLDYKSGEILCHKWAIMLYVMNVISFKLIFVRYVRSY